jgi:DNA helicase IV
VPLNDPVPPNDLDTELADERQHLIDSRAALARMRGRAEALYSTGDKVAGDAYTAEQLGRHMARRVAELADDPTTPLFFGRLDIDDTAYHVGRRHVTDDAGEPMVLDWRAPLSRSFYRASVRDPQGV